MRKAIIAFSACFLLAFVACAHLERDEGEDNSGGDPDAGMPDGGAPDDGMPDGGECVGQSCPMPDGGMTPDGGMNPDGGSGCEAACCSDADCPEGTVCEDGWCVCDGDPDDGADHSCHSGKTLLCHYPPGSPSNEHEICVGTPAVPAHLAHGDTLGDCP